MDGHGKKIESIMARLAQAYPEARCALDHGDPFQLLVATVLSAQCTDARVNLTTPALFARFPDPAALAGASSGELESLIHATGFFRNKARNLVGMAQALLARHGGRVPGDMEALAALPGVGRKTANVVLANAFGVPALPVDTHLFRVARRLGLSTANTPEGVEADLCAAFPRDAWILLHHQLITHGRRVCDARRPACPACPLLDGCPTGEGRMPDPHTGRPVVALTVPSVPPSVPPSVSRSHVPQPAAASAVGQPAGAGAPRRIVSLVPSFTELLAQWGLTSNLAGRTRYCVAPPWIRATVPAVGGTKDPDVERIRALAPDLVLMERDENRRETAEALQDLAIPILSFSLRTASDCARALRTLGAVLGLEGLGREWADRIEAALERTPPPSLGRALVLVWKDPWMSAGPDTYLGDLARQAGFEPVGARGYAALSLEDMAALDPQVVFLPTEPYRFNARSGALLRASLPLARVQLLDGRAVTWTLSRTEAGLALFRSVAAEGRSGHAALK
jgi:endonuclease-3